MNTTSPKQKSGPKRNSNPAKRLPAPQASRRRNPTIRHQAFEAKLASALLDSSDQQNLLQTIVRELGAALAVCRCRILLLDHPQPELSGAVVDYVRSCCKNKSDWIKGIDARSHLLLRRVLATSEALVINNAASSNRRPAGIPKSSGVNSFIAVALRPDGTDATAILTAEHCELQHTWNNEEIELVKTVAKHAALSIRQARLHHEVRESAKRAALISHIITSIRRSLDLNETLKAAVEEIGRALGADRTYFRKLVGDEFLAVAEYLSDPAYSISGIRTLASDYIGRYLLESRRTLVIDDVNSFKAAHPELAAGVGIWHVDRPNLSQIVCPIIVNNSFWGAISIAQVDQPRKWTGEEVALIEVLAAQIEVAVSHSRLFDEARQAADRESLISHIIHRVNQSNQLDEILPVIASELGEHLGADQVVMARLSPEEPDWMIEYDYSNGGVTTSGIRRAAAVFSALTDIAKDDVIRCDDVERDPRAAGQFREYYLDPRNVRSFMAARLRGDNSKSELIILANMRSEPRHWSADDVEVLRAALDQVFIALQRAELFEQVLHVKHQWESTFDALTDGILIFDREGILVRINEAGAAFEGSDVNSLLGRRCCELMQGAEGDQCRVSQVVQTGRPLTFELVPGKLGRPLLVTISPLTNRQGGSLRDDAVTPASPIGAVCVVRDLSELRAAEAVAREQRNFLVKLIEHANDAIFAFSPEGRFIWFNEQLVTLSGYSRVELSSADYRIFVTGDDKKVAVERFARAMIGEPQTFEIRAMRKDGDERLLMMTFTPIYDEGGVSNVLSIARDITEERLASERAAQADKLRALGQLASGVAHNFNNILAAIVGHAQLIKRDFKDEVMGQRMAVIERAAMDGAETVKRIQAFGMQQNTPAGELVDFRQLVRDSTELTRARWSGEAHARGLNYEVELNLKEAPSVRGSASELREVFVNIILNALDAMPQGGKIRISTDTYGPNVRAIFTDTGIGMSREISEHIFEPFFTTKGAKGMGLGLAVSYSIIERHRGRIEVASAPGRGTTFTISIQMAEPPKLKVVPQRIIKPKIATVLVIDDDDRVREALVGMLSSGGHQVEWASSAREGLAKLELGRFDLVFTDLSMPEMDGWALATEIRRGWPSVKIVLVTGYGVPPDTLRHYRELVDEVAFKPINLEHIQTVLSQIVT